MDTEETDTVNGNDLNSLPSPSGETASSSYPKERRFKLSRACDRCRRRRIRCDEGHPCQSCLTSNSPCTFEEPGKRTHPHKSKRTTTLEERLHHLESLIQTIPANLFTSGIASLSTTPPGAPPKAIPPSGTFPASVAPPSLSLNPLINPSGHFPLDELTEATARLSIAPSYLYIDEQGSPRWQGESSGLPLLEMLVERGKSPTPGQENAPFQKKIVRDQRQRTVSEHGPTVSQWFPDRQVLARPPTGSPQLYWKMITSRLPPDLMDSLVKCYLSTSYYLAPILHVPTFLSDYSNPQNWGDPSFACLICAICAISARHFDDLRVRSDQNDRLTAGLSYFELFGTIRTMAPDQPTLPLIQSTFLAAVFCIGLGKLSKGFALLAESVTLAVDAGMHRNADAWDLYGLIENEVRKKTFYCIYSWDKQVAAAFGRPPVLRYRDVDVLQPVLIDDEYMTDEKLGPQPPGVEPRVAGFVWAARLYVVLEAVLDTPPSGDTVLSPFRARASSILSGFRRSNDLVEQEAFLDELMRELPSYWKPTLETSQSEDVLRIVHSHRIYCLEQFIRMLINRHRFSEYVRERTSRDEPASEQVVTEGERSAMMASHNCALRIVEVHLTMASKGLMVYYGLHVIHQLTQAGRTLVAVLINCKTEDLKPLVPPCLDGLKSCVGLLRRFSSHYVCSLRNGDLLEEFCRITGIPLEVPPPEVPLASRPAWSRPIPKRGTRNNSYESGESDTSSPRPVHPDFSTSPTGYVSPDSNFGSIPFNVPSHSEFRTNPPPTSPPGPQPPISGMSQTEFMMLLNDINANAHGEYEMTGMPHPGVTRQPPQVNGLNGLNPAFLGDMQVNGITGFTGATSAPLG